MFAITLEPVDLQYIADCVSRADTSALSQQDKRELRKYWQGGLNAWATAPLWGADTSCPLCVVVTCDYGTAAEFTYLLTRVNDAVQFPWAGTDTNYLRALVADLVLTDIHEPWPPA